MEVCRQSLPELDNRWPDQGGHTTSRSLSSRGRNHRTIIIIRSTETCRCCETANWGISAAGSRGHTMRAHGSNRRGPLDPACPDPARRRHCRCSLAPWPGEHRRCPPELHSPASTPPCLPTRRTARLRPRSARSRAIGACPPKSRRLRGSTRTGAATTAGDSGSSGLGCLNPADRKSVV